MDLAVPPVPHRAAARYRALYALTSRRRLRFLSTEATAIEAEEVLRGRLDYPISTSAALSNTVGVSERTLRNAFADVHRESPKRYFLNQRLRAARQALSGVRRVVSVTTIATEYGSSSWARFALHITRPCSESLLRRPSAGVGWSGSRR